MKKALLYLFLFGMLFLKSSYAFPLASTQNNSIDKFQNWSLTHFEPCQNIPTIIKTDFINDFDNENDNDECNSHSESINKKVLIATTSSCSNYSDRINFVFKISNAKTYFIENCSQITRFNYLSLRVLRL